VTFSPLARKVSVSSAGDFTSANLGARLLNLQRVRTSNE